MIESFNSSFSDIYVASLLLAVLFCVRKKSDMSNIREEGLIQVHGLRWYIVPIVERHRGRKEVAWSLCVHIHLS